MNLNEMSNSDFTRKLNGVFRLGGEVFKLVERSDGSIYGSVLSSTDRWMDHREPFDASVIDYSFPLMGYVNYKSGIVYCIRKAARQWSIVYNQGVVEVVDPQSDLRSMLSLTIDNQVSTRPAFIRRLFDRQWFSYKGAIESLRTGKRIAAAINQHVAIAQSAVMEGAFIIYYKNKIVGWVDVGDVPTLYKEADYVAAACPFDVKIEDV